MVAKYAREPLYVIVSTNDKSYNNILSIEVLTHPWREILTSELPPPPPPLHPQPRLSQSLARTS